MFKAWDGPQDFLMLVCISGKLWHFKVYGILKQAWFVKHGGQIFVSWRIRGTDNNIPCAGPFLLIHHFDHMCPCNTQVTDWLFRLIRLAFCLSLIRSERIDLERVPQVIHEAVCLAKHSCNSVDSSLSLDSIPISIKIPVLRTNPGCLHHSLEFESVTIACICATARWN